MSRKTEILGIDNGQLKYKAIITDIQHLIRDGKLIAGDSLPSITAMSKKFSCARETVVKAYNILKKQGVLTSQPGKGFFLASDTMLFLPKVFLMLNSLSPYMEVLYNSFIKNIEGKAVADVFFHHNNITLFKEIINNAYGKYHSYIIKPFEHQEIDDIFSNFSNEELMILDRREGINSKRSYIAQNFIDDFYECLNSNAESFRKYHRVFLIFTKSLTHPVDSISAFERFAVTCDIKGKSLQGLAPKEIVKGDCYIVLGDNELVELLRICKKRKYKIGKDIGIVSYNDTPMKEFIADGITVFTADFQEMGLKAATFAIDNEQIQYDVHAQTVLRGSL